MSKAKRPLRDVIADLAADAELTPLGYIESRIHAGADLSSIAREIGYSREAVSVWVNSTDEGKAMLASARVESAHAYVDEAYDLLKNCSPDREEVALVKEKVALLLWKAARANRTEFGSEMKTSVNVLIDNNRAGFLDALRVRIVRPDAPPQLTAGDIEDAQIEPE